MRIRCSRNPDSSLVCVAALLLLFCMCSSCGFNTITVTGGAQLAKPATIIPAANSARSIPLEGRMYVAGSQLVDPSHTDGYGFLECRSLGTLDTIWHATVPLDHFEQWYPYIERVDGNAITVAGKTSWYLGDTNAVRWATFDKSGKLLNTWVVEKRATPGYDRKWPGWSVYRVMRTEDGQRIATFRYDPQDTLAVYTTLYDGAGKEVSQEASIPHWPATIAMDSVGNRYIFQALHNSVQIQRVDANGSLQTVAQMKASETNYFGPNLSAVMTGKMATTAALEFNSEDNANAVAVWRTNLATGSSERFTYLPSKAILEQLGEKSLAKYVTSNLVITPANQTLLFLEKREDKWVMAINRDYNDWLARIRTNTVVVALDSLGRTLFETKFEKRQVYTDDMEAPSIMTRIDGDTLSLLYTDNSSGGLVSRNISLSTGELSIPRTILEFGDRGQVSPSSTYWPSRDLAYIFFVGGAVYPLKF